MLPPIADRFVAGESIDGAVAHVRSLDDAGIAAIVNHLGEHHDDPADARADAEEYLRLLERLPATVPPAATPTATCFADCSPRRPSVSPSPPTTTR